MTKRQRRKFEMFLRVRDFYNEHAADFPAASVGGLLFAALFTIIEQLEQLGAKKVSVLGEVGQAIDVKGDAKDILKHLLEDVADMAAAMSYEFNGLEDKFRVPHNKSVPSLIAAGRAFAADAVEYKAAFINYGLAPDFIEKLLDAVESLNVAFSETSESTQERVGTNAALIPLFKDGMEKVNRLQPIVKMKYRNDAAKFSAWIYASHVAREPQPAVPQPTA